MPNSIALPCDKRKTNPPEPPSPIHFSRRKWLTGVGAALAGIYAARELGNWWQPRARVFIARNQRYDGSLVATIREGLSASGIDLSQLRGKRVLLKPNLVEPTRLSPQMTTHPAMIVAAAEVFRQAGAQVVVGEGPGHVRDTEMALVESGVQEVLQSGQLEFADLNYQSVGWLPNLGHASKLPGFWFPQAVIEADLIVSLPKLKTHHWVGMTGALKNLYGTIPGIKYGWPKNVLHHAGIPQTVFDINASLPKAITIVDGITCMEGDGPIMGSAKHLGIVLVGANSTAVDATICRIMGLDPARLGYLQLAAGRLGPIRESSILQTGERWQTVASPFQILDRPYLQQLRIEPGALVT